MDLSPVKKGGITINRLFEAETPIWSMFGKLADIAVLSLLWTVCSLPVITMGAASAALMRCVLNMQTGMGNWRARHFFRYFKSNLRNATLLWLIYLVAAALFIMDLLILSGAGTTAMRVQRTTAVIGLILWVITAVWAFALTSQFENSLIQTLKNSFYLAISWLPRTIIMGAAWVLPVALLVFFPYIFSRIFILWPALFFGGTAYLCSKLMIKPLTPYYEDAGIMINAPNDEFEEPAEE